MTTADARGETKHVLRSGTGVRVSTISLVLNALLALVKGTLGIASGSVGLIADAVHSLGDAGSSLIVLAGFRIAAKPADREHPFGHGRAEHIATSFLAALLLATAFEFGKTSIERLQHPQPVAASLGVFLALVVTIACKEWLFAYTLRKAKEIDSDALRADAWHHRSDSISTLLVILGLIGSRFGLARFDAIAGLLVALLITHFAVQLLRASISRLLGEAPTAEEIAAITARARAVPGVLGVHDVIVHRYGERRWVSLHIDVAGELSATQLHSISDETERQLDGGDPGTVIVHADPLRDDHPQTEQARRVLSEAVDRDPLANAWRDLRLIGPPAGPFRLIADIAVPPGVGEEERAAVATRLERAVKRALPPAEPRLRVRPEIAPRE